MAATEASGGASLEEVSAPPRSSRRNDAGGRRECQAEATGRAADARGRSARAALGEAHQAGQALPHVASGGGGGRAVDGRQEHREGHGDETAGHHAVLPGRGRGRTGGRRGAGPAGGERLPGTTHAAENAWPARLAGPGRRARVPARRREAPRDTGRRGRPTHAALEAAIRVRSSAADRQRRRRSSCDARVPGGDAGGRRVVAAALGASRTAHAATAWRAAIEAQIAEYEAADAVFPRARGGPARYPRPRAAALAGSARGDSRGRVVRPRSAGPPASWRSPGTGGGIALFAGSPSHVAMLARARGVPMMVGSATIAANERGFRLLDAEHGRLIVLPDNEENGMSSCAPAWRHRQLMNAAPRKPAVTADGVPVAVSVNIAATGRRRSHRSPHMRRRRPDADGVPVRPGCRTRRCSLPAIARWNGRRGDPSSFAPWMREATSRWRGSPSRESNPFLGTRGIRLALARPEVFRVQFRALLRAATYGNLNVMLPMVSVSMEYDRPRARYSMRRR